MNQPTIKLTAFAHVLNVPVLALVFRALVRVQVEVPIE
jgi:hypothetical protein